MTTTKHYDGELSLSFNEDRHWYFVDGEYIPGVTSILKFSDSPAKRRTLEGWRERKFQEFLELRRDDIRAADEVKFKRLLREMTRYPYEATAEAADIGTLVHSYAERYIKEEKPELPENPTARRCAKQFVEWFQCRNVEPLHTEFRCVSREHWYAGTADLDAIVNGERAIVDFKTSKGMYESFGYQLAAYQHARQEELGIDYAARYVARFDKNGGVFDIKRFDDYERDLQIFLLARQMYKLVVEDPKKRAR